MVVIVGSAVRHSLLVHTCTMLAVQMIAIPVLPSIVPVHMYCKDYSLPVFY